MTFISKLLCGMVFFSMMTIECMFTDGSDLKDGKKQLSVVEIKDLCEARDNYSMKVVVSKEVSQLFAKVKEQDNSLESMQLDDILINNDSVLMKTIQEHFMCPIKVVRNGADIAIPMESDDVNYCVQGEILQGSYFMFKTSLHAKCVGAMVKGFLNEHNKYVALCWDLKKQIEKCTEEGIESLRKKCVEPPAFFCRAEDVYSLSSDSTKMALDVKKEMKRVSEQSDLLLKEFQKIMAKKDESSQSNYKFTQNSLFLIAIVCSLYGLFGCMRPELVDIKHIQGGGIGSAAVFFIAMLIDFYLKKE